MAILKCKMCGGDLEIADNASVTECEYCGTKQTLPKEIDENLQSLFNRANTLRIKSEFDKAEKLYEKIVEVAPNQAEAYWGLILCKYGIEYVDDPKTFKKIPTCHRASYDSIIADGDFASALEYADIVQRAIYEEQAREIDRIQKEILALASNEEKYDVFICYKETDNDGRRTQDSVIANDIYYQLTQEGLKVFYAAITLENKLGSAYEPIIFAALNSARVMLAIGTKPEYFNAVWVKNEWSRYLKILKKDHSKLLIPCYRDMDAYELPEEFAHLQAQDMSKIGFINDIVRGIKKVVTPATQPEPVQQAQVIENANGNAKALLDRGFIALEDGEWKKADDFFEQALNFDAKLADAYLGKLMADLCVKKKEDIKNSGKIFNNNNNYQRTLRFCDAALKEELEGYLNHIMERARNENIKRTYEKAINQMNTAQTEAEFKTAGFTFDTIKGYQNAEEMKQKCLEKAEYAKKQAEKDALYRSALNLCKSSTISELEEAVLIFRKIRGYKDTEEKLARCETRIIEARENIRRNKLFEQYEAEFPRSKNKEKIEQILKRYKQDFAKISYNRSFIKYLTISLVASIFFILLSVLNPNWLWITCTFIACGSATFLFYYIIGERTEYNELQQKITEAESQLEEISKIPTFEEWLKAKDSKE